MNQTHLQPVPNAKSVPPPVPKPNARGNRDLTIAIAGTFLGALLAFVFARASTFLDERSALVDLPPRPVISAISLSTPELIIPVAGGKATAPSDLKDQKQTLRDYLEITSDLLTIPLTDPDARAVLEAAKESAALDRNMTSPLGVLDIDAWVENITKATATIASSYSRIQLLTSLKQASAAAVLADRKRLFRDSLRTYPDYAGALTDLVILYDRAREDERVVALRNTVRNSASFRWRRKLQDAVILAENKDVDPTWPARPNALSPDENKFLWQWGLDRDGSGVIDFDGQYVRIPNVSLFPHDASWQVTQILAEFRSDHLNSLFSIAIDKLGEEIQVLTKVLTTSDKLLKTYASPRIYVDGTIANRGKSPVTVTPESGIEVKLLSDNKAITIPLTLTTSGEMQPSRNGTYMTVASGAVTRARWMGRFSGPLGDWLKLRDAYRSGALSCEIAVATPEKAASLSPDAKFEPVNQPDSARLVERRDATIALFAAARGK